MAWPDPLYPRSVCYPSSVMRMGAKLRGVLWATSPSEMLSQETCSVLDWLMICTLGLFSLIIPKQDCWSWGKLCHRPYVLLKDLWWCIIEHVQHRHHSLHCRTKCKIFFSGNDRKGVEGGWGYIRMGGMVRVLHCPNNPRPHPVLNSMCMKLLSDIVSLWNVHMKQAHFGEFSLELVCFWIWFMDLAVK